MLGGSDYIGQVIRAIISGASVMPLRLDAGL